MDNYELRIRHVIQRYYPLINNNKNIIGIGLGNKTINGITIDIPCLKFYVKDKISSYELDSQNMIPQKLLGLLTDVVDVSKGKNDNYNKRIDRMGMPKPIDKPKPIEEPETIDKPARGGNLISGSTKADRVGTLAIAITDKTNDGKPNPKGSIFALSTSRVVTADYSVSIGGGVILQKSSEKPTAIGEKIGVLSRFDKVQFSKKGQSR